VAVFGLVNLVLVPFTARRGVQRRPRAARRSTDRQAIGGFVATIAPPPRPMSNIDDDVLAVGVVSDMGSAISLAEGTSCGRLAGAGRPPPRLVERNALA
jgi:hypothetical protein